MKKSEITEKYIKDNGIHYTPTELSSYMAKILVNQYKSKNNLNKSTIKVLDPACGDGELLIALAIELSNNNINFEMYGIDTNNEELEIAKERLNEYNIHLNTFNMDYIENYDKFIDFDLVIANPPYVRTQNMENDKRKKNNTFSVNGRFDLYQLFFNAITNSLKYEGLLCIITSNKFMYNKAGICSRNFLSENYNIKFILDLGDSKMFTASVLPAIFLGEKSLFVDNYSIFSAKIYETTKSINNNDSIFNLLLSNKDGIVNKDNHNYEINFGYINNNAGEPWAINTNNEMTYIDHINKKKFCNLSEWANVKVGIKTTADKVFIQKKIEDFNIKNCDLIHPMIFSKNTSKWCRKKEPERFILYPYILNSETQSTIDINKYPEVKKYLMKNEDILKKRKYFETSKKDWFEIWVCHNLIDFYKPKIVVPDISSESKFLYDDNGFLVDGNCYWITIKENIPADYLFLILGLCNSKFMEEYHDLSFQNKLYSGKRRYVSQYLNKYPMIDPNSKQALNIIKIVKKIINSNCEKIDIEHLEQEIEKNIKNYWEEINNE